MCTERSVFYHSFAFDIRRHYISENQLLSICMKGGKYMGFKLHTSKYEYEKNGLDYIKIVGTIIRISAK